MPRRRIKRKPGEGISISGPATVRVNRRVILVIEASRDARVARLATRGAADRHRPPRNKLPPQESADENG